MREHITARNSEWLYFGIDEDPPTNGKVHILTSGGQSILGTKNTVGAIAWAPLMKRDPIKEMLLEKYKGDPDGLKRAAKELHSMRHPNKHDILSDREMQVFLLLVHGSRVTQIADKLELSVKSVATYKLRLMSKLSMTSVAEMVAYAITHNLLDRRKQ